MITINPYLNFDGNCEEAFNFYKSVFGGEFQMIQRISETPHADNLPANERNRIMHVSLPVGKGNILMGSDTMPSMGHKLVIGNNNHISIHPDTKAETDKIFNALSAGGTVTMPLEETFWGAYFGMFADKFGVLWMINCDLNPKK
jgi:PhnB protein